jgi:hypothetical protein
VYSRWSPRIVALPSFPGLALRAFLDPKLTVRSDCVHSTSCRRLILTEEMMERGEADRLVRRMNAIAGTFQAGYLDLLQELSVIHGGPGPWLDDIEADLFKTAKSFESSATGYEAEADAAAGAIEAVTQFFLHARPKIV